MKKLLFILSTFLLISNVYADSTSTEIDFNIQNKDYATSSKKVADTTFTFTFNNAILDNIDTNTLNTILNQVNPLESSDLIYYENMQVLLKPSNLLLPVKDLNYVYIGQNASWTDTPKSNEMAKMQPFTSNYPIYGFRVVYRTSENNEYIETEFNNDSYKTSTLKEKLAFLTGVNEDDLVNQYNKLYKFSIPNNLTYTLRFDFYGEGDNEPILSNDYYYTSSLKLLTTRYVVINYEKTETVGTSKVVEDKKTSVIPAILFFGLLIGSCYYIKKNNLINL